MRSGVLWLFIGEFSCAFLRRAIGLKPDQRAPKKNVGTRGRPRRLGGIGVLFSEGPIPFPSLAAGSVIPAGFGCRRRPFFKQASGMDF
jgi:hypothetical protein